MILIYSESISPRLQYISKFIIQEQLGVTVTLTIDAGSFAAHEGPKINYSKSLTDANAFHLENCSLLFEQDIREQAIQCFPYNNYKAFFKNSGGDFPFDIFAASFYLISRYEEWLPHTLDAYGRYAHENSLAFKEGFLNIPLVNFWIKAFAAALTAKFPGLKISQPAYSFTPTYDIDIAWSYKNKGLMRNIGGFIKSPTMQRVAVLLRVERDPFDCYSYLRDLHHEYQLDPVYFFLLATSRSTYDKNISPYNHNMWQLVKRHAKKYRVGLHPSWKSNEDITILQKEKKILETAGNVMVSKSRQHYIKFSLPEAFHRLIGIGITEDYSMGYGSINGFRASVASNFYWYDLQSEAVSSLRLHPFCFMDANSHYEQHLNPNQAFEELKHYAEVCRGANGHLITIFHNHFLGSDKTFEGWRECYEKAISQLLQ